MSQRRTKSPELNAVAELIDESLIKEIKEDPIAWKNFLARGRALVRATKIIGA